MNDTTGSVARAPVVTPAVAHEYAAEAGVCVRPVLRTVTDRATGKSTTVLIPCGSTRESRCPPCAGKARRLRMQQCAEGWHLEDDPLPPEPTPGDDDEHLATRTTPTHDEAGGSSRRVRSTRRRSDAAELPKVPQEHRSVGRTFTAPDGTTYRPSMFVTLTLGSYGKVIPGQKHARVRGAGTPVHPAAYDYRRAAVEALLFPRLFDRWMQNLRRCAGFKVQYFGAIEPQRRLAPHIHVAMRGAIPRQVIRKVTRATYLQLWWPPFDQPVYTDPERYPQWDPEAGTYRDADTGFALPTWEEALDDLADDEDAEPAVVMRFGSQLDIQGIIAPSADADRSIRYLTKYLTKSVVGDLHRPRARGSAAMRRTSTGCTNRCSTCRARRPARTGCATGSNPRTRVPACSRAAARRRHTTGRTSASAAAGSRSAGPGQARHSPSTRPTARPSCARSSRKPGSRPRTRTGWPPTCSPRTGCPGSCGKTPPSCSGTTSPW